MICPDCDGSGRIRKRFLIFFTRRARCPKCAGTGEFPPAPVRDVVRYRTRYRDVDRDDWPASTTAGSRSDSLARDDDRFEVGSGGRSGGGGASASWDEASSDKAPVIVDPFARDSSAAGAVIAGAIAAEALGADSGSSSTDSPSADSSSNDTSSSGDSGTSY
jgi:hypothetical protein